MLKTLFDQWVNDWKTNKLLFGLELIGTVSSIAAAILISVWPGTINMAWVFLLWMVGSVSLATSAFMRSTAWPMILMITYSIFNIIGLYNTLA